MTKANETPITDINILAELERLAAAMPWDTVEIWVKRRPAGEYVFSTNVSDNEQFGWPCRFGYGQTLRASVDNLIKQSEDRRDPETMRLQKIEELKEKIRKLEAVVIGLPPYVPNRELCEYNQRNTALDISSEVTNGATS